MMNNCIQESREIYSLLGDDISKYLYNLRVLYSLNADTKIAHEIEMSSIQAIRLRKTIMEKSTNYKLYLYGAGHRGNILSKLFHEYWCGIIDSDVSKEGTTLNGIKIHSVEELEDIYTQMVVVISNKYESNKIKEDLVQKGIPEENIIDFGEAYTQQREGQYFDLDELPHCEDEVFVDCGAYDGESSVLFSEWCNKKYKKIYCFEPDQENIKLCEQTLKRQLNSVNCSVIPKGTWKCEDQLCFSQTADVASHICDSSEKLVQVTSIDQEFDVLRQEKVTFIKMDIEGAELEALKGAENVIRKYTPKLAISIYHKPEDIFTIPSFIRSINSNYKFYLRHYTFNIWDTVLYAVPQEGDSNVQIGGCCCNI